MGRKGKKKAANSEDSLGESKDRCIWSDEDVTVMIQYIAANRAKAGDGLNFDKTFWIAVAAEMAKHPSQGAAKSFEACQAKWGRVSFFSISAGTSSYTDMIYLLGTQDVSCCRKSSKHLWIIIQRRQRS